MLGFVVPVKQKKLSKNWEMDNALLERTVRSLCQQTLGDFMVYIVHNEKPEIGFSHEKIMFCRYPFDFLRLRFIKDAAEYSTRYSDDYLEKMMDKARRFSFGAKIAKDSGCSYVMSVDSDDLISNKICQYVENNKGGAGWRITKGYIYNNNSFFMEKNNKIYGINGSTHIIRGDLVKIPCFESTNFVDYNLFEAHGYTAKRIYVEFNLALEDLPFPGVVYVVHDNNCSGIRGLVSHNKVKNIIKIFIRGLFINKEIRREFCIYNLKS